MNKSVLKNLNLSENETIIYEILLNDGPSVVSVIAEKAKLGRVNTYVILRSLVKKELVFESNKKKKLAYAITSPKKLLEIAAEQKEKINKTEVDLLKMMPKLISHYKLANRKPGILFFEGIDGAKEIFNDVLKVKPKEVLVFRSIYDSKKIDSFLDEYTKKRVELKIKTKIISPKKPSKELLEKDKKVLRQRIYVPEKIFTTNAQINIYNNRVAYINYVKNIQGIIIENADVAQTMKTVFDLVWNTHKKISP